MILTMTNEDMLESLVENYIGTKTEIREMIGRGRRLGYWTAIAGLAGAVLWALNLLADLVLKFI